MSNPYASPSEITPPPVPQDGRPTTATLFGILNILFGAMGILFSIIGMLFMLMMQSGEFPQAELPPELQSSTLDTFNLANTGLSCLLAIPLIIGGIGLLKFRNWGRQFSNWWACASLVLLAVAVVMHVIFMLLPAIKMLGNIDPSRPEEMGAVVGTFAAMLGFVVSAIYPICVLFFLNRRTFKAKILQASA